MCDSNLRLLAILCLLLLAGCSISGHVTLAGAGLDGVTVKLEGPAQSTRTTGVDGGYKFAQLLSSGTYTATPSKPGHEMTPPSRQVTLHRAFQHVTDVDFSARQLVPVDAPLLGYGTGRDLQNDGAFDNVNTASTIEARSTRLAYLNQYVTERAIFEFDLSGVSRSVPPRSAILDFAVIAYGSGSGSVQLDFWGYRGDGVVNLADAVAGDSLVGSVVVSSIGAKQIDLTAFVQQVIAAGSSIAGLNVRMHSETITSNIDEHCTIVGTPTAGSAFAGPRLIVDY
jgi:hypothetical protein